MSLSDYYDLLAQHDWYFSYSDDGRVYRAGVASLRTLREIARESEEHQELYLAFQRHYFSGAQWGTEKQALPERPRSIQLHAPEAL